MNPLISLKGIYLSQRKDEQIWKVELMSKRDLTYVSTASFVLLGKIYCDGMLISMRQNFW